MFNIDDYKVTTDAIEMKLMNPYHPEKETGAVIMVLSIDHKDVDAVAAKIRQRQVDMKNGKESITLKDSEAMVLEQVSAMVVGWSGLGNKDGEEVKFDTKTIGEFLTENDWITTQIMNFSCERRNFTKA
tara:strand:+ start:2132 stop:2518 length:387 start_codon:yes stop_codon:yes gene_type:complete